MLSVKHWKILFGFGWGLDEIGFRLHVDRVSHYDGEWWSWCREDESLKFVWLWIHALKLPISCSVVCMKWWKYDFYDFFRIEWEWLSFSCKIMILPYVRLWVRFGVFRLSFWAKNRSDEYFCMKLSGKLLFDVDETTEKRFLILVEKWLLTVLKHDKNRWYNDFTVLWYYDNNWISEVWNMNICV